MTKEENAMFNYVERYRGRTVKVLQPETFKGSVGIIKCFEGSFSGCFIRVSLISGQDIASTSKSNLKLLPKK